MTIYDKVYALTKSIPRGKVTTYGQIGKKLNISPRYVGRILHENPTEDITPCHRIVTADGRVAPGFAFGGQGIQRSKLEKEGVTFRDDTHVDMKIHFTSLQ